MKVTATVLNGKPVNDNLFEISKRSRERFNNAVTLANNSRSTSAQNRSLSLTIFVQLHNGTRYGMNFEFESRTEKVIRDYHEIISHSTSI